MQSLTLFLKICDVGVDHTRFEIKLVYDALEKFLHNESIFGTNML